MFDPETQVEDTVEKMGLAISSVLSHASQGRRNHISFQFWTELEFKQRLCLWGCLQREGAVCFMSTPGTRC